MVIVVEGKNDYNKIKSVFPEANIVITNGSAVDQELILRLTKLSEKDDIVLCLDPDFPGNKIRDKINRAIPNAANIYAKKSQAISHNKRKVGIEHMSKADIISLFENVKFKKLGSDITMDNLIDLGLVGQYNSKELRLKICEILKIGYCNSKTLLNRLNMYGYTLSELKEAYDS
ncbi:MAG: ribonuclease M5 [Bacilli bacterium]